MILKQKIAFVRKYEGKEGIFTIVLPGSKSLSLRALVLAALASGNSRLQAVADCDDIAEMMSALAALGCKIEKTEDSYLVHGTQGKFKDGDVDIKLGLSGTSTRFLIAIAFLRNGITRIDGHPSLRARPNKYLVDAIRELGATVDPIDATGLPLCIVGAPESPLHAVHMQGDLSSQFFSALLQVAPLLRHGLTLKIIGNLVSKPYVDITIEQMRIFGVLVQENSAGDEFRVEPQVYKSIDIQIEGDASGASYFAALAVVHGVTVKLSNLGTSTLQGDYKFIELCKRLGATVDLNESSTLITGSKSGLLPIPEEIDMEDMPDVAPTLIAIAPLVPGGLRIKGLATLRVKECDRLAVPAAHLRKLGVSVNEGPDYIEVSECKNPSITVVDLDTHDDHRIAMSFAVLASKWGNIRILESDAVGKTFPLFWNELSKFGAPVDIE